MAGAKKKSKQADPISERARSLNDQIASLEAEIKKIDSQLHTSSAKPKLRSTAIPHGATISRKTESPPPKPLVGRVGGRSQELRAEKSSEPVFEEIKKPAPTAEPGTPEHYNELGVRKYDLPALWKRIRNHFRSPTTSNPRLVNYLVAGGVQGLRPLRYEKRVARNRFVALAAGLFFLLLCIILTYIHYH